MGMAAGQARLLSITARLSDNEQSGQSLSFAKQRLADEADQINREYNEALNATKLTVLTGFNGSEAQYTDISYGLLTEYNKESANHFGAGKQYLVTDQKGKILVTDKIANAYKWGNGDFNYFLAHVHSNAPVTQLVNGVETLVSYNAKGLSQNDVDFRIPAGLDEDELKAKNAENEQIVHDAWDKYLTSVGLSFEDLEHDYSDPDVEFGWNATSGTPQIESKYIEADGFAIAAFKNEQTVTIDGEEHKVPIIEGLPLGVEYVMHQPYNVGSNSLETLYGEPRFCFNVGSVTYWIERETTANRYGIYIAEADKSRAGNYITSCSGSAIQPRSMGSGLTYATEAGTDEIEFCHLVRAGRRPVSYDGTTVEQRELYDYACALTQAKYEADHKINPDLDSIADNPENAAEIKYYRNIFDQMQQFGYVTEADMKINMDITKLGMRDSNWFEQGLRQGKLLLKTYDASKGDFVNTTYAEDSSIQEVEDDRKIAKAQADYDQAQTALERKDKKIDLELKKLDTEHNALQTEYESVKSVVDKNIEKSFNIFS